MLMRDAIAGIRVQAQYYYYFAGMADKLEGRTIPIEDGVLAYTTRVPVGVVGCHSPVERATLYPHLETRTGIGGGVHGSCQKLLSKRRYQGMSLRVCWKLATYRLASSIS